MEIPKLKKNNTGMENLLKGLNVILETTEESHWTRRSIGIIQSEERREKQLKDNTYLRWRQEIKVWQNWSECPGLILAINSAKKNKTKQNNQNLDFEYLIFAVFLQGWEGT